jgi:hypothetical protein
MDALADFLSVSYGDGDGDGDGSGYGSGYGSGSGYGYGYGPGSGYGSGSGSGYGDEIKAFDGHDVHSIDGVQTLIDRVRGNAAKGFILQADLTLKPCYVVKAGDSFAHGSTLKEATEEAQRKSFEEMDDEDRIAAFLARFPGDAAYPGSDLFDWHGRLTGSCLMGREQFVRDRGIDLSKSYTVAEFVEIAGHAYGGEIVRRLA